MRRPGPCSGYLGSLAVKISSGEDVRGENICRRSDTMSSSKKLKSTSLPASYIKHGGELPSDFVLSNHPPH